MAAGPVRVGADRRPRASPRGRRARPRPLATARHRPRWLRVCRFGESPGAVGGGGGWSVLVSVARRARVAAAVEAGAAGRGEDPVLGGAGDTRSVAVAFRVEPKRAGISGWSLLWAIELPLILSPGRVGLG